MQSAVRSSALPLVRLRPTASCNPGRWTATVRIAQRALSSRREEAYKPNLYFTYYRQPWSLCPPPPILDSVKAQSTFPLANPDKHDAAVLLMTPDLGQHLDDEDFMRQFAQLMTNKADVSRFHVMAAIVDPSRFSQGETAHYSSMSVLRGHLDDILPRLWEPETSTVEEVSSIPLKVKEDSDAGSALTFAAGLISITLPLAKTMFLNGRTSTLLLHQYEMVNGVAKLSQLVEKHDQTVNLPLDTVTKSMFDIGLDMGLMPITLPRLVENSFGNIVKGIKFDRHAMPVPASTELEAKVNDMHEYAQAHNKPSLASAGIWAAIAPSSFNTTGLRKLYYTGRARYFNSFRVMGECVSGHIRDMVSSGGRVYKILSGGGGWGDKKGLLSLDPQESYFAHSEEEQMERFKSVMDGSGFAPKDSSIQYFVSCPEMVVRHETGFDFEFGVSGESVVDSTIPPIPPRGFRILHRFVAHSSQGLFLSWPNSYASWKLSVPHSRIFLPVPEERSSNYHESKPPGKKPKRKKPRGEKPTGNNGNEHIDYIY